MFDLECLQRCCIGLHCSHTQNYLAYMHVVTVPLPLPLSSIWRYRKYEAKGMNYPKIRASGVRTLKRRDYKVVFRRRILAFTRKGFFVLIYPGGGSAYSCPEIIHLHYASGEVHVSVCPCKTVALGGPKGWVLCDQAARV